MQWRAHVSQIHYTSLCSSLRSFVSGCFAFRREDTQHVVIVQMQCALSGLPAVRLGHAFDIFVSLLKQMHTGVPAYGSMLQYMHVQFRSCMRKNTIVSGVHTHEKSVNMVQRNCSHVAKGWVNEPLNVSSKMNIVSFPPRSEGCDTMQ